MGHMSIIMWIQVHYNKNTFPELEISNFTIFNQKYVLKFFAKVKILNS